MANCKLTRNILKTTSCGYQLAEVKDIYLANYVDVHTSANTVDGCEEVTNIELDVDPATSATSKFYHIEPARNSVTFTDELVVEDNGAKYRTHTLTFSISNRYDSCLHVDFDDLSLGRFAAVVVTADGNYLMLGRTAGLEASAATLTGSADTNGMEITLSANVAESAMPLSKTAKDYLLANIG